MNENLRRLCAATILAVANEGNTATYAEVMAQYIASYIVSAEPMDSGESLAPIVDMMHRVQELLHMDNRGGIWDELVPGPVRDEPEWDKLVDAVDSIMENGAPMLRFSAHDIVEAEAQLPTPRNIVLDCKLRIERDLPGEGNTEVLFADRAEVFMDEHGIQWIKFIAKNGNSVGKEHMIRTDSVGFTIVRMEQ